MAGIIKPIIIPEIDEIEDLDDVGHTVGYFVKGHYLATDFVQWVALEHDEEFDTDQVKQEYWREVPVEDADPYGCEYEFVVCQPDALDAYPVTCVYKY